MEQKTEADGLCRPKVVGIRPPHGFFTAGIVSAEAKLMCPISKRPPIVRHTRIALIALLIVSGAFGNIQLLNERTGKESQL